MSKIMIKEGDGNCSRLFWLKTKNIVQIYHYKNSELKRAILNKNQPN